MRQEVKEEEEEEEEGDVEEDMLGTSYHEKMEQDFEHYSVLMSQGHKIFEEIKDIV